MLLLPLLLAACGAATTPTIPPSPTPAHLTIATVLAAWDDAGLAHGNAVAFGSEPPPAFMTNQPGVVAWKRFDVESNGLYYLLQFATPEQAADARANLTTNSYDSYRRDTMVLCVSKYSPNIPTHIAVFLSLP
jgi:hypothetical protein